MPEGERERAYTCERESANSACVREEEQERKGGKVDRQGVLMPLT